MLPTLALVRGALIFAYAIVPGGVVRMVFRSAGVPGALSASHCAPPIS